VSGQSYHDFVVAPPVHADVRQEIPLIDDTEFFKKYESTAAIAPRPVAVETVTKPTDEKSNSQKT
jgi:hypothetical protein